MSLIPEGDFSRERSGEQKLVEAILTRTILDLGGCDDHASDAAEWIWDRCDPLGATAFSFEWCCYEVGLEPEPLRRALRAKLAA